MRRHIHEGSGVGRWCVLAFTVCASFCLHAQEWLQPVAGGRSLSASRQARPPAPAAGQRAQTTPPATAGLFKGRRPSAGGEWTGTSTWPGLSLQIRISVDPTGATVTSLFTQVDCTSGRGGARNEWSGESEIDDAGRFAFPGELGRKTKGRFGPDSFASGAMRFSALTRAFEGHFVSDDVIEGTYSSPVELKCGDEFARVTGAWTARRRDAAPAPANAQAGPATRSADPAPAGAFSIRDEYFINRSFQETSDADFSLKMEGDSFTVGALGGAAGRLKFWNAKPLFWGHGAMITFIDVVSLSGYSFASDTSDPLKFQVDREKGFTYIKGKGTVSMPDGKIVKLPPR